MKYKNKIDTEMLNFKNIYAPGNVFFNCIDQYNTLII